MISLGSRLRYQVSIVETMLIAGALVGTCYEACTAGQIWVRVCALVIPALGLALYKQAKASRTLYLAAREDEIRSSQIKCVENMGDGLPIGLFLAEGHRITHTNKAWDELVGRLPGESAEAALDRTSYLVDAQNQRIHLQLASEKGLPTEVIVRHASEDGIVRFLQTFATQLRPGQEEVVGLTFDITEATHAHSALQRQAKEQENVQRLLRVSMAELSASIEALVRVLVRAVEAKDPYTAGHSERVMAYAVAIGEKMELSFHDLRTLEIGCLVHDIGKIGVPDSLLTKPTSLTDTEFEIVAEHAAQGSRILEGLPLFQECLPIVRGHHERLDGTGYPDRLRGDQIPIIVRIAMVADAFDAMTSTRAYRHGMHPMRAIEELQADAEDGRLDPEVVAILADMVKQEGLPGRLKAKRAGIGAWDPDGLAIDDSASANGTENAA